MCEGEARGGLWFRFDRTEWAIWEKPFSFFFDNWKGKCWDLIRQEFSYPCIPGKEKQSNPESFKRVLYAINCGAQHYK